MDARCLKKQHDVFSSERDELNDMADSYNYHTYEREQRLEMLLASTRNEEIKQDMIESTSLDECSPLNSNGSSYDETTTISIKQSILVMVACIYIHCAWNGLSVSLGITYVELIEVFHAPRANAALIQSLYMGTSLGGGVLFAKMLNRFNPGHCIIISSLMGTAAIAGASLAENITTLVALLGVLLGTVMSCSVLATFVTVARVFTTNRKFALALLTIGQTIGQICTPFVTYNLIENYNWNGALLVLSGITTLNCIPCGLVIMSVQKSSGHKNNDDNQSNTVSLFKDPLIYVVVFTCFIYLLFGPVEHWFSADLAVMKGFTFAEGTQLLSVNGGAGFAGRLLGALFIQIFKDVRTEIYLMSALVFWGISHYTIYLAKRYWILVLCMTLRGLSSGLVVATVPIMQLELVGVANFATMVAVCDCLGGLGEILGGYIGGLTVDITGNYQVVFLLAALSALYSAGSYIVVFCVLSRRRRVTSFVLYTTL